MLMRQISSKEDPDLFTTMSSSGALTNGAATTTTTSAGVAPTAPAVEYHPQTEETIHNDGSENTTLDDVWGDDDGDNDDVWGDGDGSHTHSHSHSNHENCNHHPSAIRGNHPSDIPRLQQEHTTAGYRDGITIAKAEHVQAGFDEGFGLGATIGALAGQLLGVLEGLVFALSSSSSKSSSAEDEKLRENLKGLLAEAEKDLSVQSIYGKEYWDEDGTWRYEVPGESREQHERVHERFQQPHQHEDGPAPKEAGEEQDKEEDEEEAEILFPDVALAHPLIEKWDRIIREELAERFGLVWDVTLLLPRSEEDEHEDHHENVKGEEEKKDAKPVRATSQALAW
ncbi:hypothetical protein B0T20DRAFT_419686 [Sordaria brevicollis]|uniref:Protein YAE1 n=1 Tax=Sordaria brevicollis TaxID=83679 RepID=A0AAE0U9A5_SORBR|nr:hypothetical protein B0T20DRAFT_419686 [Sordaria brevicollis]